MFVLHDAIPQLLFRHERSLSKGLEKALALEEHGRLLQDLLVVDLHSTHAIQGSDPELLQLVRIAHRAPAAQEPRV